MLMPATRPCLLACVPRATTTGRLDERDVEPAELERLGHLEADVAAADDDRVPWPALVEESAQDHAVVEHLHPEDAVGVDPRQRRAHRHRPGRDHQLVEALPRLGLLL